MSEAHDEFFENLQQPPKQETYFDCEFISCDFQGGSLAGKTLCYLTPDNSNEGNIIIEEII